MTRAVRCPTAAVGFAAACAPWGGFPGPLGGQEPAALPTTGCRSAQQCSFSHHLNQQPMQPVMPVPDTRCCLSSLYNQKPHAAYRAHGAYRVRTRNRMEPVKSVPESRCSLSCPYRNPYQKSNAACQVQTRNPMEPVESFARKQMQPVECGFSGM